jgi:hypothetical protein
MCTAQSLSHRLTLGTKELESSPPPSSNPQLIKAILKAEEKIELQMHQTPFLQVDLLVTLNTRNYKLRS